MISINPPKHALEAGDQTQVISAFSSEVGGETQGEQERRRAGRRLSVSNTKSTKRAGGEKVVLQIII